MDPIKRRLLATGAAMTAMAAATSFKFVARQECVRATGYTIDVLDFVLRKLPREIANGREQRVFGAATHIKQFDVFVQARRVCLQYEFKIDAACRGIVGSTSRSSSASKVFRRSLPVAYTAQDFSHGSSL